jgi:POT family proton-dependent oligopeptide transporter
MSHSTTASRHGIPPVEVMNHPAGLFILFFTEMWERFSYYGMRALLVLFLVSDLSANGWGWPREEALSLYGTYTGLVYLTPILGGYLADKLLGFRLAVIIGALLMTLGHASMAMNTEFFFYTGLGLLIAGNGLFKPNISSIVGGLYSKGSDRKDGAYTIFYMGINAGAFLGILLCGYVGETVGWHYGFGLAGIFMFLGMLQFVFAQKMFGDIGAKPSAKTVVDKPEDPEVEEENPQVVRDRLIVIGVLAFFTIFFWMAFEQAGGSMTIFAKDYTQRVLTGEAASWFVWVNTALTLGPIAIITYVLFLLFKSTFRYIPVSNVILASAFAMIWAIALWMVYNQLTSTAYQVTYQDGGTELVTKVRVSNPDLKPGDKMHLLKLDEGKFRIIEDADIPKFDNLIEAHVKAKIAGEVEVAASWFGILNSFFIIAFAPLFSRIWESKFNPSAPVKFALGLFLLGAGFAVLAYGASTIPKGAATASVSLWFLVVAYWFHTMGELSLSPVGLSYVSKLSPSRLVGLMFGIWFLSNAAANKLAGMTGSLIDTISEQYGLSSFFLIFTVLPVAAGLIMLALTPFLKKKMHGIH